MARLAMVVGVLVSGFAGLPSDTCGQTQSHAVARSMTSVFGMVERSFTAVAEAMPADRYEFRLARTSLSSTRSMAESRLKAATWAGRTRPRARPRFSRTSVSRSTTREGCWMR